METLYIGNLYHSLDTAQPQNIHVWTMFLSVSPSDIVPPSTVDRVVYYLHPTFHPSTITVREPPFYLMRRGWGYFDVRADIFYKKKK